MNRPWWRWLGVALALGSSAQALGAVTGAEIQTRTPFTLGVHELEALSGELHFEWDPGLAVNQAVVDLDLAPRNEKERVQARASFFLIQPKDPAKRQGVLLEVSNRGSKAALRYFNGGPGNAWPDSADALGDGLIQELGLSLMWVGWQPDVPREPERMYAKLPRVAGITGDVRSDWTLYQAQTQLLLVHRDGLRTLYPVDSERQEDAWLTHRLERDAVPALVPRDQWQFRDDGKAIQGEFRPGIYELVYPARDPVVVGLGLAIIRDTAAYLKRSGEDFRAPKVLGFGVSQTGRFLRQYLYQGFNQTESGGRALDGVLIHTAGAGRGSFNHRFAQPSRDAHRMSAFFYPTDLFPFTSRPVAAPVGNRMQGLLDNLAPAYRPNIMVTNTGYEYWGRAAGLIHSHDGHDVLPAAEERIYHLASAQHFVERAENLALQEDGITRGNNLDLLVHLRALLSHLVDWTLRDLPPPPSQYPRFALETLVPFSGYGLPPAFRLSFPKAPHTAYLMDYGSDWQQGLIAHQPPRRLAKVVPPVPALDAQGNELGGIRHPLLSAPLATFLPWHRQTAGWAKGEMTDFRGSLVPLPDDAVEPYRDNKGAYLDTISESIDQAIHQGWVLPRDRQRVMAQAEWLWHWRFSKEDKSVDSQ